MSRFGIYIVLFLWFLCNFPLLLAQPLANGPKKDLSLYYSWQEIESRDSAYFKAYRQFRQNGGIDNLVGGITEATRNKAVSPPANGRAVRGDEPKNISVLSEAFKEAFWVEKDYDRAFYIGFQLEEKLPLVTEGEYPGKRSDYFRLGEAYYLLLDFHKSIELLQKALSPFPLSFDDTANLDALYILGICYAMIGDIETSDKYFRSILLSEDNVLRRNLYNAYSLSQLGCNEMIRGNYNNAMALSWTVWPVLRKTNDYGHLAGMCYCRGRSFLGKGEYKEASQWIDSLVYFSKQDQYNRIKRIKQAYLLQSDYYVAMGDANRAKLYNDSLVGVYIASEQEYTSQYIVRAAQRYNSEKIIAQENKIKVVRTRGMIISLIALLSIVVTLIITSLYRKRNAAYKVLARKAEEWANSENTTTTITCAKNDNGNNDATDEDRRIMAIVEQQMTVNHAYREPGLTMEFLADRMGIHRNILSRASNRVTGNNFTHYINGYRVREAVRIISETDRSQLYIDELYERVGFGNRSSFYRAFKQFTGLSPIEFQKKKESSLLSKPVF